MADAEPVERKPQECIPSDAYSPDGVDRTLIRWMLAMTPAERLEVLQSSVRSIQRMRDAASRK